MGALPVLPSSRPRRKVGVVDIEAVLALVRYRKMYALSYYAFGGGDTPSLDAIPPCCPVLAACCKTLPDLCLALPEFLHRCIFDFLDPRLDRTVCAKRYSFTLKRCVRVRESPWWVPDEGWALDTSAWTSYSTPSIASNDQRYQSYLDRLQEVASPTTP